MRKLRLVVLFLLLTSLAYAGEVRGKVVSVLRGEPLRKVRVVVLEKPQQATTTADDGSFKIENVPPGKYTLQASVVGYRLVMAPFSVTADADVAEFSITMAPSNFRRTDVVEVKGDIFQGENPAVPGQINLTAAEIKESSTVLADDPFRSVQSLPGVVPTENNDFFGEFSVLGAPFSKVSVYVDDVLAPHPFHSITNLRDGGSLSVFSSETVDQLTLLPIAFPERYGDSSGAALDIHTREGSRSKPLFTASLGLADSNFIGEGELGAAHKGSWLASGRKSYLGYLVHRASGDPFTDVAFEDADLKLSYDLNSRHNVNFYAIDGHTDLNQSGNVFGLNDLKSGGNDFTLARLGWSFAATPHVLLDTHGAYIRQRSNTRNLADQPLGADYYGEWVGGTRAVWNWSNNQVLEAGYSGRRLRDSNYSVFYFTQQSLINPFPSNGTALRQSGYVQQVSSFFHQRLHLMGGVRWDHEEQVGAHPISPQVSAALQVASRTTLQLGFGRYAQLPDMQTLAFGCGPLPSVLPTGAVAEQFMERSNHYTAALEQRLGENLRVRVEVFDRENRQLQGGRVFGPSGCGPVVANPVPPPFLLSPSTTDHSRGLQFIIQRRSANRLSGWIGYTLGYARQGIFPFVPAGNSAAIGPLLTGPMPQDQRHTLNAFGTYRLTPSINLSGKLLFGSGLPLPSTVFQQVGNQFVPVAFNQTRLGQYQRLDLRMDKAWAFTRWKMTLYGEGLNLTNHDNRRLLSTEINPVTGQAFAVTEHGLPITPTAGLVFEF
ncbi:MAG TPA: carboxypeptidase regulatory-like domain-containing protein [Candidatus Angelobacter sp.]